MKYVIRLRRQPRGTGATISQTWVDDGVGCAYGSRSFKRQRRYGRDSGSAGNAGGTEWSPRQNGRQASTSWLLDRRQPDPIAVRHAEWGRSVGPWACRMSSRIWAFHRAGQLVADADPVTSDLAGDTPSLPSSGACSCCPSIPRRPGAWHGDRPQCRRSGATASMRASWPPWRTGQWALTIGAAHPAAIRQLPMPARVALTLRAAGSLTVAKPGRSLQAAANIGKQKIRNAGITTGCHRSTCAPKRAGLLPRDNNCASERPLALSPTSCRQNGRTAILLFQLPVSRCAAASGFANSYQPVDRLPRLLNTALRSRPAYQPQAAIAAERNRWHYRPEPEACRMAVT